MPQRVGDEEGDNNKKQPVCEILSCDVKKENNEQKKKRKNQKKKELGRAWKN